MNERGTRGNVGVAEFGRKGGLCQDSASNVSLLFTYTLKTRKSLRNDVDRSSRMRAESATRYAFQNPRVDRGMSFGQYCYPVGQRLSEPKAILVAPRYDDYGASAVAKQALNHPDQVSAATDKGLSVRERHPVSQCDGAIPGGSQLEMDHRSYLFKKIEGKWGNGDEKFWGRNVITDPRDEDMQKGKWPPPPELSAEERERNHQWRIKMAKRTPRRPLPSPKKKKEPPKPPKLKKPKPQPVPLDQFAQHEKDIQQEEPEIMGQILLPIFQ